MKVNFFAVLTIFIGLALVARYFYMHLRIRRINNWLCISAEFGTTSIETIQRRIKYTSIISYRPHVNYQFFYLGTKFSANTVGINKTAIEFATHQEAVEFIQKLKIRSVAFVNPENANQSLLCTDISPKRAEHYRILLIAGILLLGCAGALLWI